MDLTRCDILNITLNNGSILKDYHTTAVPSQEAMRLQQSQAMFTDLNRNQYQKCEDDFIKNQYLLRKYYGSHDQTFAAVDPTKSHTSHELNLIFSPNDQQLVFDHTPPAELDDSTRDDIFVFSMKNVAKIAQLLNLNCDKLRDLFIKIINEEDVTVAFLNELNSKMVVTDQAVGQCEDVTFNVLEQNRIDTSSQKLNSIQMPNPIFNSPTAPNGSFNEIFKHSNNIVSPEIIDYPIQVTPQISASKQPDDIFKQITQSYHEYCPSKLNGQQFTTGHSHSGNDYRGKAMLNRNMDCKSPDLFSDCSDDDDIIRPS